VHLEVYSMRKPKFPGSYPSRTSRRWTASEAQAVLDAQEQSGLTAAQFAAREGFDVQRFYRWRRQLSRGAALAVPAFTEITLAAAATRGDTRFEVELASGHLVRVPAEFDGAALRRLVAALEAPC
jgi:transposase-like protein